MSHINFQCPFCHQNDYCQSNALGSTITCKNCFNQIEIHNDQYITCFCTFCNQAYQTSITLLGTDFSCSNCYNIFTITNPDDSIFFSCPNCHKEYDCDSNLANHTFHCQQCQQNIKIPTPLNHPEKSPSHNCDKPHDSSDQITQNSSSSTNIKKPQQPPNNYPNQNINFNNDDDHNAQFSLLSILYYILSMLCFIAIPFSSVIAESLSYKYALSPYPNSINFSINFPSQYVFISLLITAISFFTIGSIIKYLHQILYFAKQNNSLNKNSLK
ncbi:MAG: hypothetical protein ACRC37_06230 [Lentisphaeria bacterium]